MAHIPQLLEKMLSHDQDIRFMALNDLKTFLEKDEAMIDERLHRHVVQSIAKLLEDKNGEVQNMCVKCLPPLVTKINAGLVGEIIKPLSAGLLGSDDRQRDIASIGLKSVITQLSVETQSARNICNQLTATLITALNSDPDDSVVLEMLDVLNEILRRFGKQLNTYHDAVQTTITTKLLLHSRMAVRKRAIGALSCLASLTNDALFKDLMKLLVSDLSVTGSVDMSGAHVDNRARTIVQLTGALTREAGDRLTPFIGAIVPAIVTILASDDDDDLRDSCVQTLESFALRCPKDMGAHAETLVTVAIEYLQHDPNYNYDDDDEDGDDDMEDDGSDDDDDDGEYSDDDDISWKVRRAAATLLATTIKTQPSKLAMLCTRVASVLTTQFKEREENVRMEVFAAYRTLLQQMRAYTDDGDVGGGHTDAMVTDTDDTIAPTLLRDIPTIVRILTKQAKERNLRVRQGLLGVLGDAAVTLPGCFAAHLPVLMPCVKMLLNDKQSTSNVKIDALVFVSKLMDTHEPSTFHPHIAEFAPAIVDAVNDSFYKVTSEALQTVGRLIRIMRPQLDQPLTPGLKETATKLHACTFERFSAVDLDQEVKEHAIQTQAQILYTIADEVEAAVPVCLPIFLSRLQNESTRVTATNAIAQIATSPLAIDLASIAQEVYVHLASFLKQNSRAQRLAALSALQVLVDTYDDGVHSQLVGLLQNLGSAPVPSAQSAKRRRLHKTDVTPVALEAFTAILAAVPPLIDCNDLTSTQLSVTLVTQIVRIHPALAARLQTELPVVPALLRLSLSPILQGTALAALRLCLKTLATSNIPELKVENLLDMLWAPVRAAMPNADGKLPLPKQAFANLAKCIATLAALNTAGVLPLAERFVLDTGNAASTDAVKILSLLALGEVGKDIDLSSINQLLPTISNAFALPSERVKSAAAFALGNVSAGNTGLFLPLLVTEIRSRPAHNYLLLHALKELVTCKAASTSGVQALSVYVKDIWSLLLEYSDGQDEGMRSVVAECLGNVVLVDPAKYISRLTEQLTSPSASLRCTIIQAFKFTVSARSATSDDVLREVLPMFLKFIGDDDINVKRMSLVTFNSTAHNKPRLVRALLPDVLPLLYTETHVRKEHIRIVQMGPFKQPFDDGLDARKTAFECLLTVLEKCPDFINLPDFVREIRKGLDDQHDIQILVHLCLLRLVKRDPESLLGAMADMCTSLEKILTQKAKKNEVKVNLEKMDERKKVTCRTVKALVDMCGQDVPDCLTALSHKIQTDPVILGILDTSHARGAPVAFGASGGGAMDTS